MDWEGERETEHDKTTTEPTTTNFEKNTQVFPQMVPEQDKKKRRANKTKAKKRRRTTEQTRTTIGPRGGISLLFRAFFFVSLSHACASRDASSLPNYNTAQQQQRTAQKKDITVHTRPFLHIPTKLTSTTPRPRRPPRPAPNPTTTTTTASGSGGGQRRRGPAPPSSPPAPPRAAPWSRPRLPCAPP